MFAIDLMSSLWMAVAIAAVAFALALPIEYLCHRRGWGLGARLLAWTVCAVLIVTQVVFFLEEMCSTADEASARNCVEFVYFSLLPIFAGVLLLLWSVLYAVAVAVCRSIYRRALA